MTAGKIVGQDSVPLRHQTALKNWAIGLGIIGSITACCSGIHVSGTYKSQKISKTDRLLPKCQQCRFEWAGIRHDMYWRTPPGTETHPTVLLLHELNRSSVSQPVTAWLRDLIVSNRKLSWSSPNEELRSSGCVLPAVYQLRCCPRALG